MHEFKTDSYMECHMCLYAQIALEANNFILSFTLSKQQISIVGMIFTHNVSSEALGNGKE